MPTLLVCVEGSAREEDLLACREQFEKLAQRKWTHSPVFVDQVEQVPATGPDDVPELRTVGVALMLPDPGDHVDEVAIRRDVAALIDGMSSLAERGALEFVVQYREEEVGFLGGGPGDTRFVAEFFGDT